MIIPPKEWPKTATPIRPIGPPNQLIRDGDTNFMAYSWDRGVEVEQIRQHPGMAWDEISRAVAYRKRSLFVRDAARIVAWVALIAAVALR